MDIILDTNIYQANFSLKSTQMEALTAYLQKTDKHLVLPYVISNELVINYRKELKKSINDLRDAAIKFRNCVTTPEYDDVANSIFNLQGRNNEKLDKESSDYIPYVKSSIGRVIEVDLPELDVKKIVDKALKKEKPFKDNGEGFKDTVIWESLLSYCRSQHLKSIIFISNNSKDFGEKKLSQLLQQQADEEGIEVYYYNSLDSFIKDKFETIKDVRLDESHIDKYELGQLIEFYLKDKPQLLSELFKERETRNIRYNSFQGIHDIMLDKIADIIIKDVSNDFKYVNATLICKIGIVCVAEHYYEYTDHGGDFDYDHYQELDEIVTECLIDISLKLSESNTWYSELEVIEITFP